MQASINRPLTTGDRVWADAGARAEIQVGGALMRLNAGTGVSVLNLDDRIVQLQLTQGAMNVRVRRLEPNQAFEVDTPNLAFTLRRPGDFRIEVDADGNATTIIVRNGQGEVYGESASYVIDFRQPYRFTGTGLREYQLVDAPRLDEFDRWSGDRDRSYANSPPPATSRRTSIGYQDLDDNGPWRDDATYGNVWCPTGWWRLGAVPHGHWTCVDPWGWTWVDDAPWGFAVSHYGRWANLAGPGAGARSRCAAAPTTPRPWWPSWVATTSSRALWRHVGGMGWFASGRARSIGRPIGEPRLLRERQREQHRRQHDRHQQLLQQHQRDQRHLREPSGSGRRHRGADDRVRAVATGVQDGDPGHTRDGRRAGRSRRARRTDRAKRAWRRRPGTSRQPGPSSDRSSHAPLRPPLRSASLRNSSS